MFRRVLALVLAFSIAIPSASFAVPESPESGNSGSSFWKSSLFWGALTLMNGAILASSIADLQFYQSRAEDLEAAGEDAGDYWDASSREKIMIGVSGVSLLFSLAAWKSAAGGRSDEPSIRPIAPGSPPIEPGVESGVQVLSHEGRIRYDTLLTAQPPAPFEWYGMGEVSEEAEDAASPPASTEREAIAGRLPDGQEPVSLENLSNQPDVFTQTGVGEKPSSPLDPASPADDLDRLLEYLKEERVRQSNAEAPPPDTADLPPSERSAAGETGESAASPDAGKTLPAPPPKETAAPAPSIPREESGDATFSLQPYGVHISSYRTMTLAEKDEENWAERGYRVVIEEDEIPEKGTWFRVFLGNFESLQEAKVLAAELKERYGLDYAMARKRSGF